MKCLTALTLILAASPAFAQVNWNSSQMGNYTYYNGFDSQTGTTWTGTSQQMGNYRYQQFQGSNGQMMNCTSNRMGMYTYTNCN